MSRIGKSPVAIPSGVNCSIEGDVFKATGKNGTLSAPIHRNVTVEIKDNHVIVTPKSLVKTSRMLWGTTQRLVRNVIIGVTEGFVKKLEITGVGYRAQLKGNVLGLQLGFSHDVDIEIPQGLSVKCEKPTSIEIAGADKQIVGSFAAQIRDLRRPEPYKGKGVRYEGEYILRKEGKKK